jgi:glycosyltransferase involved in cell wall biosynthesis
MVIVRDGGEDLIRCVESARWCDSIVIVDDHSSDDAVDRIQRRFGPRVCVLHRRLDNFGAQKRAGIAAALPVDWVLNLDSDERLDPSLARAMQSFLAAPVSANITAVELNRLNFLFGRPLTCCDQSPNWVARLFRPDSATFVGDVHESLFTMGRTVRMSEGVLLHDSHDTLVARINKAHRYARLAAAGSPTRDARPWGLLTEGARHFVLLYLRRGGWRAGWVGLAWSSLQAYESSVAAAWLTVGQCRSRIRSHLDRRRR